MIVVNFVAAVCLQLYRTIVSSPAGFAFASVFSFFGVATTVSVTILRTTGYTTDMINALVYHRLPRFYCEILPIVQCWPFQPLEQIHVPFLHWPCWLHRESHGNWSHFSPVQPASQEHRPRSHEPWGPQFKWHKAANGNHRTHTGHKTIWILSKN